MKDLIFKYMLKLIILAMILMPFFESAKSQSKLQFSPENFVGNRSNNYQHIINASISSKIRFTNFAYLDSDYQTNENLYNLRNTFSYSIFTGATYQKGFTSESFGSILYSPKVSNNLIGFLKATFSLNIDKRGITRSIQQFRLGIKNKEPIYGFAGNFDQFNYNKQKLANYGFFVRTTF